MCGLWKQVKRVSLNKAPNLEKENNSVEEAVGIVCNDDLVDELMPEL